MLSLPSEKSSTSSSNKKLKTCVSNRKPRRHRPGTVANREIRKYEKTTELLAAKSPFKRFVRELLTETKSDLRHQANAWEAYQTMYESTIVELLTNAKNCAGHVNRVTIKKDDIELIRKIRHEI